MARKHLSVTKGFLRGFNEKLVCNDDSDGIRYLENGNVRVNLPVTHLHIRNQIGEDNPALLVAWIPENVEQAVKAINEYPSATGLFGILNFPVKTSDFERGILDHVAQYTSGENIENCLIAPNTSHEFSVMYIQLCSLGLNKYLRGLDGKGLLKLPLGRIYSMVNKKNMIAIPHPGAALDGGIPLFL